MQHLGDITKLDGATIEPVWRVTGGSPCQDLSIAGKRAGLAGARSGLFMEQIRVVKEMREHDKQLGWTGELIRPRYMVWENVPGAFSSNKGRDFAAVLEETIRIVEPEAPGVEVPAKGWPTWGGYRDVDGRWSVAWRVHDAQYWGVPQRRRRIALVADFGGDTAHEILFERTGVHGHPAESGAAWERPSGDAESGADKTEQCLTAWDCQSKRIFGTGGKSPTLQGGVGGGVNNPTIFCYGISAYESNAMKSSNPHSGIYEADTSRTLDLNGGNPACNQGGIAVVSYALQGSMIGREDKNDPQGDGVNEDVSFTLNTVDRHAVASCFDMTHACGGNKTAAVAPAAMAFDTTQITSKENGSHPEFGKPCHTLNANAHAPCAVLDMTHACDVIRECGETAQNLHARMGTGGNQVPLTYQDVTGTLSPGAHAGSYNGQDAYNDMLVCGATPDVSHALRAKANCAYREDAETYPVQNMVVRRLTPLECERLQGFPDGWTDIGDYTDSTGKQRKTSDSARYKALGNSIALPFWRWMFGRMAAYLPEGATLGSLFDGIGGFPLCWEDIHGAGTAIWASEIEEFPIAVTKKRFGGENMIHYALNIEPPVEPPAYTCPRCPVCGEEADSYYKDKWGNIVGCPECVQEVTSWET